MSQYDAEALIIYPPTQRIKSNVLSCPNRKTKNKGTEYLSGCWAWWAQCWELGYQDLLKEARTQEEDRLLPFGPSRWSLYRACCLRRHPSRLDEKSGNFSELHSPVFHPFPFFLANREEAKFSHLQPNLWGSGDTQQQVMGGEDHRDI